MASKIKLFQLVPNVHKGCSGEDNMMNFIKKMLTFHYSDLIGIGLGFSLLSFLSDMNLFNLVISPILYAIVFVSVILLNLIIWVGVYRADSAYIKRTILAILKDFFRIVLSCISVIGIYFLVRLTLQ